MASPCLPNRTALLAAAVTCVRWARQGQGLNGRTLWGQRETRPVAGAVASLPEYPNSHVRSRV